METINIRLAFMIS